mmetsp:Transcript_8362/g.9588  ORF Transcript_8362/g.9588 Transcript_8362/m.9588 type:complete len:424 (+) Transcript_8362:320-1591(+)
MEDRARRTSYYKERQMLEVYTLKHRVFCSRLSTCDIIFGCFCFCLVVLLIVDHCSSSNELCGYGSSFEPPLGRDKDASTGEHNETEISKGMSLEAVTSDILEQENTVIARNSFPFLSFQTPVQAECPRNIKDLIVCPNVKDRKGAIISCSDCILNESSLSSTFYAPEKEETGQGDSLYLPLLVPPDFGSSVLSEILGSSPSVSTMCKKSNSKDGKRVPWQCESTWLLINNGIFSFNDRWNPHATNWTDVYRLYDKVKPWENGDAPILLDKSPPNIAKAQDLVEFYTRKNLNYRFIIMWRHPCRKDWNKKKKHGDYALHLRNILEYIPKEKRFLINYDDLITRPARVIEALLGWLPELRSLSLEQQTLNGDHSSEVHERSLKGAHGTLSSYILSKKCSLSLLKKTEVSNQMLQIWAAFEKELSY